jgi:hypothetical protein
MAAGIVVAGNQVRNAFRRMVGVDHADNQYAQLVGLDDGAFLAPTSMMVGVRNPV